MKKILHKIKRRHIFLFSAVIIILVSYFVFLCTYCRNYTLIHFLLGTTDVSQVRVECSPENIVKVKGISQNSFKEILEELDIELESVGHGDVTVTVYYDDIYQDAENHQQIITEHRAVSVPLHVTFFGLIYNRDADNFNGLWTVRILTYALLTVVIIYLCLSFHDKRKKGEFSYQMVTIGGLIFFFSVFIILSFINMIQSFGFNSILSVDMIIYDLSDISTPFVYYTIVPFMAFCILLSISNIILVRHEGFRIHNLLGVLLGFAVVAGLILMYLLRINPYSYPDAERRMLTVIHTGVAFLFCYLESLMASTVFCALTSASYKINKPMDYIIILGCAIRRDGSPTPLLRSRIDRAIAFDREQAEKWGHHAKFVPSGGQGSDEVISEAESMKRYLMEQGIPEERILKEDKSVNTYQNMAFSKKVIESDAGSLDKTSIAFSTTNYHVFRGYTLAHKLRMKVEGLSAKTKLYFSPNAFLREFIGLLFEKKMWHLFFIISGSLFFSLLYFTVAY